MLSIPVWFPRSGWSDPPPPPPEIELHRWSRPTVVCRHVRVPEEDPCVTCHLIKMFLSAVAIYNCLSVLIIYHYI